MLLVLPIPTDNTYKQRFDVDKGGGKGVSCELCCLYNNMLMKQIPFNQMELHFRRICLCARLSCYWQSYFDMDIQNSPQKN